MTHSKTLLSNLTPQPTTDTAAAFLEKNRQTYHRFITFLDFAAAQFTLGFASVNFGRDRETLIQAVQADSHSALLEQCNAIKTGSSDMTALVYQKKGDLAKAEDYYKKAEAIYAKLKKTEDNLSKAFPEKSNAPKVF